MNCRPPVRALRLAALVGALAAGVAACADEPPPGEYAWHTDIVATTFWVGEVFDPNAVDGSQRVSTYDSQWLASYGGCDGVIVDDECHTEPRTADNFWFPTSMTPHQNPFYLDLPYDDLNNPVGFAERCSVVPWADEPGYRGRCTDRQFSYLKNRWVQLVGPSGAVCYGQIQDAGPARYDDAAYVFGTDDARPASQEHNGAGLDVSPALNGCLRFRDLNGATDRVDWRFVDKSDVPDGPWTILVTTSGVR